MFLIYNERTKLTAAWLNILATALVAAGVFAPGAALVYGLSQFAISPWTVVVLAASCLCIGACLHLLGRPFSGGCANEPA
jgi:peptidoglycan/LPS O-acetylase OafA/YrhL